MTLQILKSVDFMEAQKSRYLENETLFFLQIKKFFNYTSRATLWLKTLLLRREPLKALGICNGGFLHSICKISLVNLDSELKSHILLPLERNNKENKCNNLQQLRFKRKVFFNSKTFD